MATSAAAAAGRLGARSLRRCPARRLAALPPSSPLSLHDDGCHQPPWLPRQSPASPFRPQVRHARSEAARRDRGGKGRASFGRSQTGPFIKGKGRRNNERGSGRAPPPPKKKGRSRNANHAPATSVAGRIAFHDEGRTNKGAGKAPRLCAGCGVEILSGRGQRGADAYGHGEGGGGRGTMAAGEDADADGRTKRQRKMARYASVEDARSNGVLCGRCASLQNGEVWKAYDALADVDADVFERQLAHIVGRRQFGLCVAVVDATDPEFTAARRLRDAIKGVPCLLAVNKSDLLPRLDERDLRLLRHRVEKPQAEAAKGERPILHLSKEQRKFMKQQQLKAEKRRLKEEKVREQMPTIRERPSNAITTDNVVRWHSLLPPSKLL